MATSFGATYTSLVPAHAASPVMGAVLPMKYRLFAYTLGWPPRRRDPSQEKLCGQIPASMLERAIQERLCRANLGLNVRHDLDIEPATRSVPILPGNVCSTRSDGLLIGYKVARQFESHPLRHTVWHASLDYGEAMKSARGARFTRGRGRGECQRQRLSVKIA